MSVLSQVNWLGNQRVELQHLRAIDSYVQQDFEALSLVLAGSGGAVVSGLTITGGSTTGFTVELADKGVVLAPVGNDAVFFANLTGSAITQTLTKGSGVGVSVYMNFYEVESLTSGGYLPLVNETTPMTFIDPNTKKAFTLDEATRRMVRVEFTTTVGANSIEVAGVAVDGTTITYKNRLFAANSTSDAVPHTLKEYVTQTDGDIAALDTRLTSAEGEISTLQTDVGAVENRVSALETGTYAKVEYSGSSTLTTTGISGSVFLGWNSGDRVVSSDITFSSYGGGTDNIIVVPAGTYLINMSGVIATSSVTGPPARGYIDLFVNNSSKELTTFGPTASAGTMSNGDKYQLNFSYIATISGAREIGVRISTNTGTIDPTWLPTITGGAPIIFTITKIGQ